MMFIPHGAPELKPHPFANLFPMMRDGDLVEFAEDIRRNGQAEPILLHRGMILDGRNRYQECRRLGLGVRAEVFSGTDREALDLVVSRNLHRRHLTTQQRAMIAAKLATLRVGDNQHSEQRAQICAGPNLFEAGQRNDVTPAAAVDAPSPLAGEGGEASPPGEAGEGAPPSKGEGSVADPPAALVSQTQAAAMLSVSRRSVQHAAVVLEHGTPELQQAVEAHKVATSTAADLATLPPEQQRQAVAQGEEAILAEAKRIRAERNRQRREERVARINEIAAGNKELGTGQRFPVIYIDPATRFRAGDSDRSTENKYPTMDEEQIAALPVSQLAMDDAVLFVWTTVPWLRKTLRIIEKWGFEYVSCAVWDKQLFGTGFWWRNQHELLLTATRGKFPAPAPEMLVSSVHRERRGEHSAKPLYFREVISAYYQKLEKVELFARGVAPPGWLFWGNQAQNELDLPAAADSDERESVAEARYRPIGHGGVRNCSTCEFRDELIGCTKVAVAFDASMTCNRWRGQTSVASLTVETPAPAAAETSEQEGAAA